MNNKHRVRRRLSHQQPSQPSNVVVGHGSGPTTSARARKSNRATGIIGIWSHYIRPHITKKRILIAASLLLIFLIAVPIVTYAVYAQDISDRDRLINRKNTGIVLKDRNGQPFYSSGVLSTSAELPLDQISDNVEKAVVASEDKSFYSHNGFSTRGTVRALVGNLVSRDASASGGSTITQQLIKNKLVGSQKNYLRKYQELSMAIAVERCYEKNDILGMYLNSIYFGDGAFGIGDAAKTYFNKPASDLNLAEASMLIGVLPAPSVYSPVSGDPAKARKAQENVLRKMVDTKAITEAERQAALATPLTYADGADKGGAEYAQHYADMVIKQLQAKYGEEQVERAGFTITTTLDLDKQKTAEQTIRTQVAKTESRGGRNAGMVAIDPTTGQVRALVGSVDYYNKEFGQVNMALALRQPGSSFKPIYFSQALDKGLITPATILDDSPMTFGGTYRPNNYDNRFKGKMAARNALAESRNLPAVEVMQKVSVSSAAANARKLGLTSVNKPQDYGLTLALGTAEVRLFRMVNVYAAFANGGKQFEPVLYTKVVDKYGKTIDEVDSAPSKQVLSPEAAFLLSSMLSDTSARAPTYGTSLNISGKTVALKTGTTNDNKDAWTIGYTPSMVVGVWLGNNENVAMRGIAGGSGAGAIWKPIMTNYLSGSKREEFVKPATVQQVTICSGTELRSVADGGQATRQEFFKKGTIPTGTCNDTPVVAPTPEPTVTEPETTPTTTQDQTQPTTPSTGTGGSGGTTTQPGQSGTGTPPTTPVTPTTGSGSANSGR